MALTPPIIFSALQQSRVAGIFPMLGFSYDRLAMAIASGVCQWGIGQPQNLGLLGAVTGISGAGAVNPAGSRLAIPPSIPIMVGALTGAGMLGPAASSLGSAVAIGISSAFTTAGQFTGPVAGVGIGVSAAKVAIANPATLAAILAANFPGLFGAGPAGALLVIGLANGISGVLMVGAGVGQVVGVPMVPPIPAATVAAHVVV